MLIHMVNQREEEKGGRERWMGGWMDRQINGSPVPCMANKISLIFINIKTQILPHEGQKSRDC